MKKPTFATSLELRKQQLHQKIAEAIELQNDATLASLNLKWAHRYGCQTIPKVEDSRHILDSKTFQYQVSSHSPDVDENLAEPDHSYFTSIPRIEMKDDSDKGKGDTLGIDREECLNNDKGNLLSENVEKVDSSLEPINGLNSNHEVDNNLLKTSARPISSMPPLEPSLNNLRRWLPRIDIKHDMPKAS